MKLVSNGCSFAYGEGLPDKERISKSYSGLLAKHFNMEHVDLSGRGASNDYITRTSILYALKHKHLYDELFFVVGLTGKSRREFYSASEKQYWLHLSEVKHFQTEKNQVAQIQKKYLSDEYSDDKNMWLNVLALQNFFQSYNIKYIMFNNLNGEPSHIKNKHLFDEIDCSKYLMMDTTFGNFCRQNNFPLANDWHPLEMGHDAWHKQIIYHMEQHDISI